jgi:hypothetical protein
MNAGNFTIGDSEHDREFRHASQSHEQAEQARPGDRKDQWTTVAGDDVRDGETLLAEQVTWFLHAQPPGFQGDFSLVASPR